MLRILSAAALAIALPLAANAASHGGGVDQMKETIMNSPTVMGMELDLDGLSDDQISEIFSVLEGSEEDSVKQEKIEEISSGM